MAGHRDCAGNQRSPCKDGKEGGDAARESGSVKLPSRDVYQGFLDHEAEGLWEKRRKEKAKEEEDGGGEKKERYLAFLTFPQQTTPGSKSLI